MQKAISAGGPHAENTAWCQAELALMSFNTGALLAAEQEATLALKLAPSNHHALAVMGRITTARKDLDGAAQFFRRSVAVTPSHDALVSLVDLSILQGRPDEAARHARRVVEFHTVGAAHSHGASTHVHAHPHPHGNAQLARFYADHDRDLDQALEEAREAYEAFPNIFVTDTLAWCLFKKGHFQEAERTIRKALKWNTPNAEIHFHAGMIYASIGNRPLAQKHLYQALSLNPQFHPIFFQTAADTIRTLSEQTNAIQSATSPAPR
jgi:tetratricopeptide (TPR) repeat protein